MSGSRRDIAADIRERAAGAVAAIVTDLMLPQPTDARSEGHQPDDPLLPILLNEVGRWKNDPDLLALANRRLEDAIAMVGETVMRPALFGGFCGVAWAATTLWGGRDGRTDGDSADGLDPCEEIDDVLLAALSTENWSGEYDLISGLVGLGVYALARLPRTSASDLLKLVVAHLERLAVPTPDGLTWFTPPTRLHPYQRSVAPSGYFNLGVAHGVPGVVGLLGHASRVEVVADVSRELLTLTVPWLLRQRLTEGSGSRLPTWLAPDKAPKAGRMAWCYGGLGASVALMVAARATGHREWEDHAVEMALQEAARSPAESGVLDACVCHGAAGNAHLFFRMYRATAEMEFLTAAEYWYSRTLDFRSTRGLGGYVFRRPVDLANPSGEFGWVSEPSFLTGSVGVGLVLSAILTEGATPWDRLLLADVPPASDGSIDDDV